MIKTMTAIALIVALASPVYGGITCQEQTIDNHKSKICLDDPGLFKHWHFTLEVDGELIFSLIDDYVEQVTLNHRIPDGLAVEMPLSLKDGTKTVTITGGCTSQMSSDGQVEVARKCDFMWGKTQIIKNILFVHKGGQNI